MPSNAYILAAVLISAALTWAMRAAPFVVLNRIRKHPLVGYLAQQMPLGVMLILLIYLLQDAPLAPASSSLPFIAAVLVTVGLYFWRRNPFLSIFGGTAAHVLLLTI